jgi:ABC-type transport system involved in cytochrome c biogenesis permease component
MKRFVTRVTGAFLLLIVVVILGGAFGPTFSRIAGLLIGIIGLGAVLARMLGLRKKKHG